MLRENIAGIDVNKFDGENFYDTGRELFIKTPLPADYDQPVTEPVKDPPPLPVQTVDFPPLPVDKDDVILFKDYTYSGRVVDENGNGIPGASVYLMIDDSKVAGVVADSSGYFTISSKQQPTSIVISSVGFIAWEWKANPSQIVYTLKVDSKDLDPVILPPGKKNDNFLWLLVIGGAVLASWRKKSK